MEERAWSVSSCSAAVAPFLLLPFSLPDGDGFVAEKAGRIAPRPGTGRAKRNPSVVLEAQRWFGHEAFGLGREEKEHCWAHRARHFLRHLII